MNAPGSTSPDVKPRARPRPKRSAVSSATWHAKSSTRCLHQSRFDSRSIPLGDTGEVNFGQAHGFCRSAARLGADGRRRSLAAAADHARRQPTDAPLAALAAATTNLRSIRALSPFVDRVLLDIGVQPYAAHESLSGHTGSYGEAGASRQ